MFYAVSSLSPVSIQIFIPALYKSSNVSGTPIYNLSSTAVAPNNSKSLSKKSSN